MPPKLKHVVGKCRVDLFTELAWDPDSTRAVSPGEAGGFFARAAGFPFPAYLKPTNPCADNHPRAANEKIVADLAAELDVPVPPVLLYRRRGCPSGQEPRACISVVSHDQYFEWGQVMGQGEPASHVIRAALSRNCGVIALDTFVGNEDRNNTRNAVFGFDRGELANSTFMFLDHANSLNMGNRWAGEGWQNVALPAMPDLLSQSVDWRKLQEVLNTIERLPGHVIEEIVSRIPDDYMTKEHKDIVLTGLKGRRALVEAALDALKPSAKGG